ncbi:ribulose-phosphate 3-epimerase [Spiroplasma helicoides]|uniref:Ribulose-phosphate 3-epimerase n=1 Tax=Spiroplasma helicoides TaxID=216938 RepID=A0A1B3SLU6_9MOLU|nr:ribulose-phosphate 3-epimerase [Spiroplasma helicoides]AOG60911.1 ribulose-phosphate 3-epimerase [Spiroplasma helicoides]
MKRKIAASIYVFNFLEVGKKMDELVDAGINMIHVDIMDGVFVNNYALCQKFCKDIKDKYPKIIVDAHIMCINPEKYIESFTNAGTDVYNFHYESLENKDPKKIFSIIDNIHKNKMKAVIAINPETNPRILGPYLDKVEGVMCMSINPGFNGQVLNPIVYENITWLSKEKKGKNLNYYIQVDGGVRENTYQELIKAGAEVFVVGAFINDESKKIVEQVKKIEGDNSWK